MAPLMEFAEIEGHYACANVISVRAHVILQPQSMMHMITCHKSPQTADISRDLAKHCHGESKRYDYGDYVSDNIDIWHICFVYY